jgi:Ribosomal protein S8
MVMTDPIADMLTRIRNANLVAMTWWKFRRPS